MIRLNPNFIGRSIILSALLAAGCREATAPIDQAPQQPIPRQITMTALSSTSLKSAVGTSVQELPSVLLKDDAGNIVAGAQVNFVITRGGGTLVGSSAMSNAAGVAQVQEWRLPTTAGRNTVTATSGGQRVEFNAIGLPGPPAKLSKRAGDQQLAPRSSVLPVRPQVKVADSFDNQVGGVSVIFAVASGGGTMTTSSVLTDSLGIAEAGSWMLGSEGRQTLTASVAGLTSVIFDATAFDPAECRPPAELVSGVPMRSELSAQGCRSTDGQSFELYKISVTSPDAYEILVSSSAFDTHVELLDQGGRLIAVDGIHDAINTSRFKVVLPVGVYGLVVSSVDRNAVGQFDIAFGHSPANYAGCENEFIVRDVHIERSFARGSCGIGPLNSDRFHIYMTAGSEVSAVLEDMSLSLNFFEVQNENGEVLASAIPKDYVESDLRFVAPADGFYVLNVRTEDTYLLTVR